MSANAAGEALPPGKPRRSLFFLQVGTRRVHIDGMPTNPDRVRMVQQARNADLYFAEQPVSPAYLLRDNDGKFVSGFDHILRDEGMEIK